VSIKINETILTSIENIFQAVKTINNLFRDFGLKGPETERRV